jgi:hypothetical protein
MDRQRGQATPQHALTGMRLALRLFGRPLPGGAKPRTCPARSQCAALAFRRFPGAQMQTAAPAGLSPVLWRTGCALLPPSTSGSSRADALGGEDRRADRSRCAAFGAEIVIGCNMPLDAQWKLQEAYLDRGIATSRHPAGAARPHHRQARRLSAARERRSGGDPGKIPRAARSVCIPRGRVRVISNWAPLSSTQCPRTTIGRGDSGSSANSSYHSGHPAGKWRLASPFDASASMIARSLAATTPMFGSYIMPRCVPGTSRTSRPFSATPVHP